MRSLRTLTVAGALLAAGILAGGAAEAQCVSRGEGQAMVAQGKVAPLPAALQRAGLAGAQVLDVELCRSGAGWSYQVRFRKGGQVSTANVPAG